MLAVDAEPEATVNGCSLCWAQWCGSTATQVGALVPGIMIRHGWQDAACCSRPAQAWPLWVACVWTGMPILILVTGQPNQLHPWTHELASGPQQHVPTEPGATQPPAASLDSA